MCGDGASPGKTCVNVSSHSTQPSGRNHSRCLIRLLTRSFIPGNDADASNERLPSARPEFSGAVRKRDDVPHSQSPGDGCWVTVGDPQSCAVNRLLRFPSIERCAAAVDVEWFGPHAEVQLRCVDRCTERLPGVIAVRGIARRGAISRRITEFASRSSAHPPLRASPLAPLRDSRSRQYSATVAENRRWKLHTRSARAPKSRCRSR